MAALQLAADSKLYPVSVHNCQNHLRRLPHYPGIEAMSASAIQVIPVPSSLRGL